MQGHTQQLAVPSLCTPQPTPPVCTSPSPGPQTPRELEQPWDLDPSFLVAVISPGMQHALLEGAFVTLSLFFPPQILDDLCWGERGE